MVSGRDPATQIACRTLLGWEGSLRGGRGNTYEKSPRPSPQNSFTEVHGLMRRPACIWVSRMVNMLETWPTASRSRTL